MGCSSSKSWKAEKAAENIRGGATEIDLTDARLGDGQAAHVIEALTGNTTLEHLDLSSNELGDASGTAIAKALDGNTTLKRLYLGSNHLGDDSGTALANMLANCRVKELWLSMNDVGDVSGAAFANALKTNTVLTTLWLSNTKLGDDSGTALAKTLGCNTTLLKFVAKNTNICEPLQQRLYQLVKDNKDPAAVEAKKSKAPCSSLEALTEEDVESSWTSHDVRARAS